MNRIRIEGDGSLEDAGCQSSVIHKRIKIVGKTPRNANVFLWIENDWVDISHYLATFNAKFSVDNYKYGILECTMRGTLEFGEEDDHASD